MNHFTNRKVQRTGILFEMLSISSVRCTFCIPRQFSATNITGTLYLSFFQSEKFYKYRRYAVPYDIQNNYLLPKAAELRNICRGEF